LPTARRQRVPCEARGAQAAVRGEEMEGMGPGELTEVAVQDLGMAFLGIPVNILAMGSHLVL